MAEPECVVAERAAGGPTTIGLVTGTILMWSDNS
jgi:hypothetical protein